MNGLINCDTYDINQILLLQTYKSILQISKLSIYIPIVYWNGEWDRHEKVGEFLFSAQKVIWVSKANELRTRFSIKSTKTKSS